MNTRAKLGVEDKAKRRGVVEGPTILVCPKCGTRTIYAMSGTIPTLCSCGADRKPSGGF
jgi:hypothetical protein